MLVKLLQTVLNKEFLFAFCTFCLAFSGVFTSLRQTQMFQQNSYFPARYFPWLKQNETKRIIAKIIVFVLFSLFNLKNHLVLLVFSLISAVFMVYSVINGILLQKKSVIKLKFTSRIKRMYFAAAVLFLGILALQIFVAKGEYYWFLSLAFLLSLFPYITVIVLWAVMLPFEKCITKYYINDAKKILKSFENKLTVVGITGSYGKTGVKNILYKMLSRKFNTAVTPLNYNTPMGVVRTVREHLPRQTEVFICEMGAKKTGDIKELCDLVHPDYAIITSVGPQHLDTFKDIRNVTNTKFELYDSVKQKGGKTFANADNEYIKNRFIMSDFICYGTNNEFKYYADNIEYKERSVTFNLHLDSEEITVTSRLLGSHNITNIVGAAALAYNMGVSKESIAVAVSRIAPVEHRLELKKYINGATLIDDAYNANPVGSIEACKVLSRFSGKKRIIVTPGLVELGEKEYECNFNLGAQAAESADIVIFVGENRSKPLVDGLKTTNFNMENLYIAKSFAHASEIFAPMCNKDTVILFENDLPDNYLN